MKDLSKRYSVGKTFKAFLNWLLMQGTLQSHMPLLDFQQVQNVNHPFILFFRFVTLSFSLIIDRIFFGQVSKIIFYLKKLF